MKTDKFQERIAILHSFLKKCKRLPSYGEMLDLFHVKSRNAVFRIVHKMIDAGLLEKDEQGKIIPVGIRNGVRMLGTVQAGFPTTAEEEISDIMSLDDFLITNHQASFLLKVSGDSMIEAGIQPGDLVLLERGRSPKQGDIVVAEVDHEWTMKYYEKNGDKLILRPANRNYPPIIPKQEVNVAGVVTAVIRKYH
mgnify:CR=1 FL=1